MIVLETELGAQNWLQCTLFSVKIQTQQMKHTSRPTRRSGFTTRRIVSALTSAVLGLTCINSMAQTHDVLADKIEAEDKKITYVLPHQKLTYDTIAYQILSDLALTRGDLRTAYQGYFRLAVKTRDPRYAERAYVVAALANDTTSALIAAQLLKTLAPNATMGDALIEQMALANILKKSESGQLQSAYQDAKAFLNQHPKHEVGLTLMADLAGKLGHTDDQLSAFEQLYQLTPNDADAMNNFGFHLIEHNIRLNEAEKLIHRALKISPNAPHIIDSAAWLAYRQGRLPQALKLIRTAVAATPHPDMQLHLAEILWVNNQTNERDEARRIFSQLKTDIEPNNTVLFKQLNETIRRLGVDLPSPQGKP